MMYRKIGDAFAPDLEALCVGVHLMGTLHGLSGFLCELVLALEVRCSH